MLEVYVPYKGKLKRKYPPRNLWKGGNPIKLLTIHGVWVNISLRAILSVLHGPDVQPLESTTEIEYRINKIQNITKNQMGLADKVMQFRLIMNIIATNRDEAY